MLAVANVLGLLLTFFGATYIPPEDRGGRIQAGYLADMMAVPGNPLDDIRLLEQPRFVLKDGALVAR